MGKLGEKIDSAKAEGKPFYSFEYFPPKTPSGEKRPCVSFVPGKESLVILLRLAASGVQNLYDRVERMGKLEPLFVDITWGAGGSTSDLTLELR